MKHIIILLAVMLAGCSPVAYMTKHPDIACKFCNETRRDTVFSTDTIILGLPELMDEEITYTPAPEDTFSFVVFPDSITAPYSHESNNGSITTIIYKDRKIYVKTRCKDDSLLTVIKTYRQLITQLESKTKVETISKPVNVPVPTVAWWNWLIAGICLVGGFYFGFVRGVKVGK